MVAERTADASEMPEPQADVAALIPMVRRIVAARVPDAATADDLVQETLVRVLAASGASAVRSATTGGTLRRWVPRGASTETRQSAPSTVSGNCLVGGVDVPIRQR